MNRFTSLVVLLLLVVVISTSTLVEATDCMTVISNVLPCSNYLKNPNLALPGSDCCNAASNWIGFRDVNSLCKCLVPIASKFLAPKVQQLSGLCKLNSAHLPLAKCHLQDGFQPPVIPFPPPLVPFPPPNENLQDGLQPPVIPFPPPLVPFPPPNDNLQDGLQPPLVPFPPPTPNENVESNGRLNIIVPLPPCYGCVYSSLESSSRN